ncbi:phage integrase family protein [Actinomadura montaniterrae]|uniref:Phage integrase family protein n=1 Tax=Actinomadura montaniterrae TaxID=1803903 RepID=A0A6L3WAD1_9ACTN|nr:phage integrase family protein [Actinomadura montaniterrae]
MRPHRVRNTQTTRLCRAGVDPAQVQYVLGYPSAATSGRYFRAGRREVAELVESV